MDPVHKTGGSNSGQKLVVRCFTYMYISLSVLVEEWCGSSDQLHRSSENVLRRGVALNEFLFLILESSDDGVRHLGLPSFNSVHHPGL
jgi:hypothetical protein